MLESEANARDYARDLEQQVEDGSRRVAELAQALREAREDAMWFLRGESGLPFDPDPHACLREIAKTCDAALEGPQ